MKEVAIVAYGAGNIASVGFAFERLGARVRLVSDPGEAAAAERLVLPGVGAAAWAMARLRALGLAESLTAFQRPLLGVCLGQQLLFGSSEEGDGTSLLGLIPGTVRRLEPGPDRPVPHMGWSRLIPGRPDPMLEGLGEDTYVYFAHGYACPDGSSTLAQAVYGAPIPAMVRSANRWGCQFHPERSGAVGTRILRNFLEIEA